jgi:hypothetical protein
MATVALQTRGGWEFKLSRQVLYDTKNPVLFSSRLTVEQRDAEHFENLRFLASYSVTLRTAHSPGGRRATHTHTGQGCERDAGVSEPYY